MHQYHYEKIYSMLLTPEIVSLLTQVHEYKGRTSQVQVNSLTPLIESASIQSTESSGEIEGGFIPDERLQKILKLKSTPVNQSEKEIAGYRDVLMIVHENYDYIPIKPGMILQLHRSLYQYSGKNYGGCYRNSDHVGDETDTLGNLIQFDPAPAQEIPESVERICEEFTAVCSSGEYDPLLLIPVFILDFLCIQPFDTGNGRMSRLLMLLLLHRAGYHVGKYISMEAQIKQSKEAYCKALRESADRWQDGENDYIPFARYLLGIILAAYQALSDKIRLITENARKPNRVRDIIQEHRGKITKAEVMEACPDISQTTIQRTLNELVKSGEILKIGGGRYTSYIWNGEIEICLPGN